MDVADGAPETGRIRHAFDEIDVQIRVDPARRDGIAANALRTVIDSDGAGQAMQAGLGAQYAACFGLESNPSMEPILTIVPPVGRRCGRAALISMKGMVRLTVRLRVQSSRDISYISSFTNPIGPEQHARM